MMKKTIITTLTLMTTLFSYTLMLQAEDNAFKPHKKNSSKKMAFTPHAAFGGTQAQGTYTKKGRTASISDGNTIYSFNIIKEDANPWLKTNKLNLVEIGSFSDKNNRFDMPAITYLFGAATDEATQNAVENSKKTPITDALLLNKQASDEDQATYSPIKFKPSKEFSGKKLIGSYLSSNHAATIQDPAGINTQVYIFENVVEGLPISMRSDTVRPMYKPVLIGSYTSTPQCSKGIPQICSNAIRETELYGNIKPQQ